MFILRMHVFCLSMYTGLVACEYLFGVLFFL
jgi:hypothetical protein